MARYCSLFVIIGACLAGANPIQEIDLASTTAWTLNGVVKPVPGGGWNAQGLSKTLDSVVYQRSITIPNAGADKVYKILFGAVNHSCVVYLDNVIIASHVGPMMPFELDLTGRVAPGNTYTLKVVAYSWQHHLIDGKGFGGRPGGGVPKGFGANTFSQGITKYVKLAVYPKVYLKDIFVRTSVKNKELSFDLWIHNSGATSVDVTIPTGLTSWNRDAWAYPAIQTRTASLPAAAVTKVTVGPTAWNLGPQSYWWPNMPFREDYQAKLHCLNVAVKAGGATLDTLTQRFGFVEYAEGPYYYTCNGVRIGAQPSDGTTEDLLGWYDGYSTCPAFLPPTGPGTGCPETWRRYMRLGINTNRTHQSTPTEYMMQAADEVGFMLVPETGMRGSNGDQYWSDSMPAACRELAQVCRNHPCVMSYSIANECKKIGFSDANFTQLIDTLYAADWTRPLLNEEDVVDVSTTWQGSATSNPRGRAVASVHYKDYRGWPNPVTTQKIQAMGEYAYQDWLGPFYCGNADLMRQADEGLDMRRRNIALFAIWTITLQWPNLLEGVNQAKIGRSQVHPDRTDQVDGWGSEEVEFLQRALDPYIVVDRALHDQNLCYADNWPTVVPTLTAGQAATRELVVFNGGFFGNKMAVLWEARRGTPTGPVAASGKIDSIAVEPGFNKSVSLSFTVPTSTAAGDTVPLPPGGKVVYKEDRVNYSVGGQKLYMILKSVLFGGDVPTAVSSPMTIAATRAVNGPAVRRIVAGDPGWRLAGSPSVDVFDLRGRKCTLLSFEGKYGRPGAGAASAPGVVVVKVH